MDLSRLGIRRLLLLSLYGLALSMTAGMLDPPVYTAKVNQMVPADGPRNTVLGMVTFAGLVVAAAAQPLWGAISDRTVSRWGRRLPFLMGGTLINLALFTLVALVRSVWLLGGVVLLLQVVSNAIQSAYQGLIPDEVPASQLGAAAGVKGLVELTAVVTGSLVAGLLLGIERWPVATRVLATIAVLQAVYLVVTVVTLLRTGYRQSPLPRGHSNRSGIRHMLRDAFRLDWRHNRDLRWWLINRFLFWFGVLTLRTFLINYLERVIGLSPAEAQRLTGLLGAALGAFIFLAILPSGHIADRFGRRPMLSAAGGIAAIGTFVLLAARSVPVMFAASLLVGLAGGLFITSSWALATALVPKDEAARYLGIANLATAGGSAAARLTGPLIDAVNHLARSDVLGYVAAYAVSGLFFLLSSWAIRHVSRK